MTRTWGCYNINIPDKYPSLIGTCRVIYSDLTLTVLSPWQTCRTKLSLRVRFFLVHVQHWMLPPCQLTAYNDVRDDKTQTNWLLVDYETERSDKLKLTGTGSGGLAELKNSLQDSNASFAYVRVKYSNDKESVREKFILVVCVFFASWVDALCWWSKNFFCLVGRRQSSDAPSFVLCTLHRFVLLLCGSHDIQSDTAHRGIESSNKPFLPSSGPCLRLTGVDRQNLQDNEESQG